MQVGIVLELRRCCLRLTFHLQVQFLVPLSSFSLELRLIVLFTVILALSLFVLQLCSQLIQLSVKLLALTICDLLFS